ERSNLIQLCEFAGFRVEREGCDEAGLAPFVHCVKKFTARMNRNERRIGSFRDDAGGGEFAARRVIAKCVNAFALRLRCVRSGKREEIFWLRLLLFVFAVSKERWNNEESSKKCAARCFHGFWILALGHNIPRCESCFCLLVAVFFGSKKKLLLFFL